ncbi:hypothetical protein ASC97_29470 [Rhizobium sp. Root1203]|nr:hypothetical protein ASC97_29470 [Rhizobium sp. Root1203]
MIAVTDTGCGMSPEIIKKAFDPFFTSKPVGKGTGLGLSQVFGFVRQSGGHLKIYSEVGTGTTMKIYLPRDHGTNDIATHVKDESVPRGTASEVVLLVEDDASVREIHTRMLEELGYNVIAVDGPVAALKVVDERADVRQSLRPIPTVRHANPSRIRPRNQDDNNVLHPLGMGTLSVAINVRQCGVNSSLRLTTRRDPRSEFAAGKHSRELFAYDRRLENKSGALVPVLFQDSTPDTLSIYCGSAV